MCNSYTEGGCADCIASFFQEGGAEFRECAVAQLDFCDRHVIRELEEGPVGLEGEEGCGGDHGRAFVL